MINQKYAYLKQDDCPYNLPSVFCPVMICYGRPSCDFCPDDPHPFIYRPNRSSSSTYLWTQPLILIHSFTNPAHIACPLYDSTRLRRPCHLRSHALHLHRALSHSTTISACAPCAPPLVGDGAGCLHQPRRSPPPPWHRPQPPRWLLPPY